MTATLFPTRRPTVPKFPAVVFVLVALVTLLAAIPPAVVAAQDAGATSTADETVLFDLPGSENAALRGFNPSGARFVGTAAMVFAVVRFDSPERAEDALPLLLGRFRRNPPGNGGNLTGVRPASVRAIGDDRLAYVGTLEFRDEDRPDSDLALLLVHRDDVVYFMFGLALVGDPLPDLANVAEVIIDREPGARATPVASDGLRTGGLWELLPRLDDLPEGFVFSEDQVPPPFDPLPGQGTPIVD